MIFAILPQSLRRTVPVVWINRHSILPLSIVGKVMECCVYKRIFN